MLDTITSRASPTAASQAANTIRMIGIMADIVKWIFRIIRVLRTNKDSIMPSRHSSDDIICDRYTRSPVRAIMKATSTFA